MSRFGRSAPINGPARTSGGKWRFPFYDSVGAGTATLSGSTLTESHNIRGNCVVATVRTFAGETASVTCGGKAMLSVPLVYPDGQTGAGALQQFYLMNPPTGSQSIVASLGATPTYGYLQSISYCNVGGIFTSSSSNGGVTSTSFFVNTLSDIPGSIVSLAFGGYAFGSLAFSGVTGNQRFSNSQGSTELVIGTDIVVTQVNSSFASQWVTQFSCSSNNSGAYWASSYVTLAPILAVPESIS